MNVAMLSSCSDQLLTYCLAFETTAQLLALMDCLPQSLEAGVQCEAHCGEALHGFAMCALHGSRATAADGQAHTRDAVQKFFPERTKEKCMGSEHALKATAVSWTVPDKQLTRRPSEEARKFRHAGDGDLFVHLRAECLHLHPFVDQDP